MEFSCGSCKDRIENIYGTRARFSFSITSSTAGKNLRIATHDVLPAVVRSSYARTGSRHG